MCISKSFFLLFFPLETRTEGEILLFLQSRTTTTKIDEDYGRLKISCTLSPSNSIITSFTEIFIGSETFFFIQKTDVYKYNKFSGSKTQKFRRISSVKKFAKFHHLLTLLLKVPHCGIVMATVPKTKQARPRMTTAMDKATFCPSISTFLWDIRNVNSPMVQHNTVFLLFF